eukprot:CAMPEP_0206246400 /NCGR_PEP_ID=MMETSP0047_2-20121206/19233_1 /ASSEMBLY_ACC=CAM_ASM_000192 /TAXON_ID=195065 /ORGANISM="Chroomonas mesostigmatica_cf, Strain CCMP1168" /LENGTH=187 /DNA_ID=CAMNT_0053671809 /DNA_START=119 /DNA_END=679 /DNA_ORIENTATION=-
MIFKNGKQMGGEVQVWSLRRGELQLTMPIQPGPDGKVHPPHTLIYAPELGCYLCVAGMNHLWACDLATLLPAGYTVLNDRKVMACAFHHKRSEIVVASADGTVRVLKVESKLVRDEVRVRRKPLCEFENVRTWREANWCEHIALEEGLDVLFGVSEHVIYLWAFASGAKLCSIEGAHKAKISCCAAF